MPELEITIARCKGGELGRSTTLAADGPYAMVALLASIQGNSTKAM